MPRSKNLQPSMCEDDNLYILLYSMCFDINLKKIFFFFFFFPDMCFFFFSPHIYGIWYIYIYTHHIYIIYIYTYIITTIYIYISKHFFFFFSLLSYSMYKTKVGICLSSTFDLSLKMIVICILRIKAYNICTNGRA